MFRHAVSTYFDRNQAVLDGTMSTLQLALWTLGMNILGYAMMAALWVFSR